MNHPNKIENYDGTLEDLAKAIGNLSYDKTAEFIEKLADDIERQADADYERGRIKLAKRLYKTADNLYKSKKEMDFAWKICEPYMKDNSKNF